MSTIRDTVLTPVNQALLEILDDAPAEQMDKLTRSFASFKNQDPGRYRQLKHLSIMKTIESAVDAYKENPND